MNKLNKLFLAITVLSLTGCNQNEQKELNKYKVSFAETSFATELSGDGEYLEGDIVTIAANPKEGYKFERWSVGSDSLSIANPYSFNARSDMEIKAEFSPIEYTVYFNCDGGSIEGDITSMKFTIEDEVTLPVATKNRFDFMGWIDTNTGLYVEKIEKGTTKDITLEAVWNLAKITVTVTCDPVMGRVEGSCSVLPGAIVPIKAYANSGYEFIGWFVDGEQIRNKDQAMTNLQPVESVTAEARFKPI